MGRPPSCSPCCTSFPTVSACNGICTASVDVWEYMKVSLGAPSNDACSNCADYAGDYVLAWTGTDCEWSFNGSCGWPWVDICKTSGFDVPNGAVLYLERNGFTNKPRYRFRICETDSTLSTACDVTIVTYIGDDWEIPEPDACNFTGTHTLTLDSNSNDCQSWPSTITIERDQGPCSVPA